MPWLVANSRENEAVETLKKAAGKNSNLDDINRLLEDQDHAESDVFFMIIINTSIITYTIFDLPNIQSGTIRSFKLDCAWIIRLRLTAGRISE